MVDMEATFAAFVGQKVDAGAAPDSFNALDAVMGRPHDKPIRENLVMHNGGTQGPFAVRNGSWKLVQQGGGGKSGYRMQNDLVAGMKNLAPGPLLFDLSTDVSESTNLAASNPQKVEELKGLLKELRDKGASRPE